MTQEIYLEEPIDKNLLDLYIVSYGSGVRYLKHPYLFDFIMGDLDDEIPESFKATMVPEKARDSVKTFADLYVYRINDRRERIKNAAEERAWMKVFMLLPKPYRLTWLQNNKHLFEDKVKYYEFLKDAWTQAEFPMQAYYSNEEALIEFYHFDQPQLMMNEEERDLMENLPQQVTIYRGIRVVDELDEENLGLSYTLSREKAEWFAKRFANVRGAKAMLVEATIDKDDILSVFLERDEDEVLVNPDKVKIVEITEL